MNRPEFHDDDAFAARLRAAYDQQPGHTPPPLPRRAGRVPGGIRDRRWVRVGAVGAVVAAAAAIPLVAGLVVDRDPRSAPPVPPVAASPTASPTSSADPDAEARGAVPECRADELRIVAGDDLALPGERRGRVVTLRTQGDRPCRVGTDVAVTTRVGPPEDPEGIRRGRLVVRKSSPYVVAPGADVRMMVSSPTCTDPDLPPRFSTVFDVGADAYGYLVADDLGTTGTCGGLALDWVVGEGLGPAGEPYALTGRIRVPGGLVAGGTSRVVATIRNPTDEAVAVPPCALRMLPGQGLVVAPRDCSEPPTVLPPGGVTRQVLTHQVVESGVGSLAFTVDGVGAPVAVVPERPGD